MFYYNSRIISYLVATATARFVVFLLYLTISLWLFVMYLEASSQMSGVTHSITFTGKNITRHGGFVSHVWQAWVLGNIVITVEGWYAILKPSCPGLIGETPVVLGTTRLNVIGDIHILNVCKTCAGLPTSQKIIIQATALHYHPKDHAST